MKRIILITFIFLMLFAMVACNSKAPDDNSVNTTPTEATNATTQPVDGPFSGLVVADDAKCAIKVTELDPDNASGYTLKVELENKSLNKEYMFTIDGASVNGLLCDLQFTASVGAGKKVNKDITLSDSVLKDNNIGEVTDIALTFIAYDVNDLDVVDLVNKTVHIYPYGSSKATKFVRQQQDTDTVIVDNDILTVIATGYENDAATGFSANLFLINKTNESVIINFNNTSLNGIGVDTYYTATIPAGCCAFDEATWSAAVLSKNGIKQVDEVGFTLRAYGYDDWFDEDDLVNMDVTLNP